MDNNIIFKINNVIIEKVNSIKYLGCIIDKELKVNDHMEFICKKIGKNIGLLRRIRSRMPIITSINIYNTIIWIDNTIYSCCSDQQVIRLQKLQNKAMRAILMVISFLQRSCHPVTRCIKKFADQPCYNVIFYLRRTEQKY